MTEPELSRLTTGWLLCCLLAGCVARPEEYVDKTRASVLVVRGHLESGELHRWKPCEGPPELLEVINCVPGLHSFATFVIDEPIVGTPTRTRLRAYFGYAENWPELKLGHRYQYLAALTIDGTSSELQGVAPLARTTEGAWAIPIALERSSYVFPCSMYNIEPELLHFREPRPREPLGEMGEDPEFVAELKGDGYTVEKGYAYATKGVPLEHVPAAYAGKSATTVWGECH